MKLHKINNTASSSSSSSSFDQQKPDITTCMEQKHNHLSDVQHNTFSNPTPNIVKKRKRFESMKKLMDCEKTAGSVEIRGDQTGKGNCTEEDVVDDDETYYLTEQTLPRPKLSLSFFRSFPEVVSENHNKHKRKGKKMIIREIYEKIEPTSAVMERAQAIQTNLDPNFPSFIKPMIRSNVTRGFWLSLPNIFCKLHLPRHDATVTLIDDYQRAYDTKYLFERNGLSAGWRGFSLAHDLVEGDVLVFHLVGVCRIKVYIVRASHLGEVDAALSLLHLEAQARQMVHAEKPSYDNTPVEESREKSTSPKPLPEDPSMQCVVNEKNSFEDFTLALEELLNETLSIADGVKANKTVVPKNDFDGRKKRSICFENLHNGLSCIRARLDRLVFRILESNEIVSNKLREGGEDEWEHAKRTLEVKILELKEAIKRLDSEIEALKINSEMLKITF